MTSRLTNRHPSRGRAFYLASLSLVMVMITVGVSPAQSVKSGNHPLGIEQLAQQLGDESFAARERAMDELWKLGSDALPA